MFRGLRRRDHHGRDAALHVEGAAAENLPVLHLRQQRVTVISGMRHRIDVPVEHQRAATAPALGDAHNGGAPFAFLEAMHLEASLREPLRAEGRDLDFPRGASDEIGIDRIDRHQFLQKFGGSRHSLLLGH